MEKIFLLLIFIQTHLARVHQTLWIMWTYIVSESGHQSSSTSFIVIEKNFFWWPWGQTLVFVQLNEPNNNSKNWIKIIHNTDKHTNKQTQLWFKKIMMMMEKRRYVRMWPKPDVSSNVSFKRTSTHHHQMKKWKKPTKWQQQQ